MENDVDNKASGSSLATNITVKTEPVEACDVSIKSEPLSPPCPTFTPPVIRSEPIQKVSRLRQENTEVDLESHQFGLYAYYAEGRKDEFTGNHFDPLSNNDFDVKDPMLLERARKYFENLRRETEERAKEGERMDEGGDYEMRQPELSRGHLPMYRKKRRKVKKMVLVVNKTDLDPLIRRFLLEEYPPVYVPPSSKANTSKKHSTYAPGFTYSIVRREAKLTDLKTLLKGGFRFLRPCPYSLKNDIRACDELPEIEGVMMSSLFPSSRPAQPPHLSSNLASPTTPSSPIPPDLIKREPVEFQNVFIKSEPIDPTEHCPSQQPDEPDKSTVCSDKQIRKKKKKRKPFEPIEACVKEEPLSEEEASAVAGCASFTAPLTECAGNPEPSDDIKTSSDHSAVKIKEEPVDDNHLEMVEIFQKRVHKLRKAEVLPLLPDCPEIKKELLEPEELEESRAGKGCNPAPLYLPPVPDDFLLPSAAQRTPKFVYGRRMRARMSVANHRTRVNPTAEQEFDQAARISAPFSPPKSCWSKPLPHKHVTPEKKKPKDALTKQIDKLITDGNIDTLEDTELMYRLFAETIKTITSPNVNVFNVVLERFKELKRGDDTPDDEAKGGAEGDGNDKLKLIFPMDDSDFYTTLPGEVKEATHAVAPGHSNKAEEADTPVRESEIEEAERASTPSDSSKTEEESMLGLKIEEETFTSSKPLGNSNNPHSSLTKNITPPHQLASSPHLLTSSSNEPPRSPSHHLINSSRKLSNSSQQRSHSSPKELISYPSHQLTRPSSHELARSPPHPPQALSSLASHLVADAPYAYNPQGAGQYPGRGPAAATDSAHVTGPVLHDPTTISKDRTLQDLYLKVSLPKSFEDMLERDDDTQFGTADNSYLEQYVRNDNVLSSTVIDDFIKGPLNSNEHLVKPKPSYGRFSYPQVEDPAKACSVGAAGGAAPLFTRPDDPSKDMSEWHHYWKKHTEPAFDQFQTTWHIEEQVPWGSTWGDVIFEHPSVSSGSSFEEAEARRVPCTSSSSLNFHHVVEQREEHLKIPVTFRSVKTQCQPPLNSCFVEATLPYVLYIQQRQDCVADIGVQTDTSQSWLEQRGVGDYDSVLVESLQKRGSSSNSPKETKPLSGEVGTTPPSNYSQRALITRRSVQTQFPQDKATEPHEAEGVVTYDVALPNSNGISVEVQTMGQALYPPWVGPGRFRRHRPVLIEPLPTIQPIGDNVRTMRSSDAYSILMEQIRTSKESSFDRFMNSQHQPNSITDSLNLHACYSPQEPHIRQLPLTVYKNYSKRSNAQGKGKRPGIHYKEIVPQPTPHPHSNIGLTDYQIAVKIRKVGQVDNIIGRLANTKRRSK